MGTARARAPWGDEAACGLLCKFRCERSMHGEVCDCINVVLLNLVTLIARRF